MDNFYYVHLMLLLPYKMSHIASVAPCTTVERAEAKDKANATVSRDYPLTNRSCLIQC